MPVIFKLRALSDESDSFLREYEILPSMSLLDLHKFICKDLNFDPDEIATFFTSDREWNQLREFTHIEMVLDGQEHTSLMGDTKILEVMRDVSERLIYIFDILDNKALFIELASILSAEGGVNYPHVARSHGEAPIQFGSEALDEDSIFDDAMGEYGNFEGDDNYDD